MSARGPSAFSRLAARERKTRAAREGVGRPRGGRTTKVHKTTNDLGLSLAIELTGGKASDYRGFDMLYDGERSLPKVLIADRGYDADRIRSAMTASGGSTVIPTRRSRKNPVQIDRFAYALRNRIEGTFGHVKNARRMATRYDQTASSYLGFVQITAVRLWVRHFVNAAWARRPRRQDQGHLRSEPRPDPHHRAVHAVGHERGPARRDRSHRRRS